jgi:hypothetical protein
MEMDIPFMGDPSLKKGQDQRPKQSRWVCVRMKRRKPRAAGAARSLAQALWPARAALHPIT